MQRIVPTIWFDNNADEAASFYTTALPNTVIDTRVTQAEETLAVDVLIDDYRISLLNGGPGFGPTPAISFFLNFRSAAEVDAVWEKLADGGIVLMALGAYDFSDRYGWVVDRFGVNWQLMLTDPKPFVVPNLMFCGPSQGKARDAVNDYVTLFPGSQVAARATYPDSGEIMFSEFQIFGEWLTAMDSAVEQPFTFTPGLSLQVKARDQQEIDLFWMGLSAVDAAERCGWLEDRYGVSWQIVPDNLGELLQRPGAYEHMMGMGKLIIDDF
ncbi:VOC family protein [Corynebacterium sp.]|uniref:VOC family protein n=1 Tax=Corynebacterium sp. TaxID=1720 RepID=UPI0026DFDFFC|nr:VOC family protein [Corynebacterium sp.]MDO5512650.1 VOC family protein [Corynebacterium sp.]